MGSLLNFGNTGLAIEYFVFVFFAGLGTLQLVAARERIAGLSLAGVDGSPRAGQVLGLGLILVPGVWFFVGDWELIMRPGLAGTELLIESGGGMLAALVASLAGASLLHSRAPRAFEAWPEADEALRRRIAAFGPNGARGRLYLPPGSDEPWPAACLVPSPMSDSQRLDLLAGVLAESGVAALVVDWSTAPTDYPGVLAVIPAACAHLARLAGIDGRRVAAVGFDLGADLVLRAVSEEQQIQTGVALAPLVDESTASGGVGLLREMTLLQVVRSRQWTAGRRMLRQLAVGSHEARDEARPVLIVYGLEDGLVANGEVPALLARRHPASKLVTIPRAGHLGLADRPSTARLVANWLREHA